MSNVWVLLNADGGVSEQVLSECHPCDPPAEGQPAAYGSDLRESFFVADRLGDLEVEDFSPADGWQFDLSRVRSRALRLLDLRRSSVEHLLSPRLAHDRKRGELARYEAGERGDALTWLSAEASARGEALEDTVERVRTEVREQEAEAAELEASLIVAKAQVRAASTVAGIGDVLAQISDGPEGE